MIPYSFYRNEYHGSAIPESNWPAIERDATAKLRQYRREYTVTAPDDTAEHMAVCAMADAIDYFLQAQNADASVQSTTIGSVSVSYRSTPQTVDVSPEGLERELYRTARMYLDIYRGVG